MEDKIVEDDAKRPGVADSPLHLVRSWYFEGWSDDALQSTLQSFSRAIWAKLPAKRRITEKEIRQSNSAGIRTNRLSTSTFQVSLNDPVGCSPYGRKQPDNVFDVVAVPTDCQLPYIRLFNIQPVPELLVTAAEQSTKNLISRAIAGEDAYHGTFVPIAPTLPPAKRIGEPLVWTRQRPGVLEFAIYLNYVAE